MADLIVISIKTVCSDFIAKDGRLGSTSSLCFGSCNGSLIDRLIWWIRRGSAMIDWLVDWLIDIYIVPSIDWLIDLFLVYSFFAERIRSGTQHLGTRGEFSGLRHPFGQLSCEESPDWNSKRAEYRECQERSVRRSIRNTVQEGPARGNRKSCTGSQQADYPGRSLQQQSLGFHSSYVDSRVNFIFNPNQ